MSHPHLSDDRLIELVFHLDPVSTDSEHLSVCTACESRRARLAGTIHDVGDVMAWEADRAFPVDRLARQRTRILQRVDQDGRPAKVISFPNGVTHDGAPVRAPRVARWTTIAAAVAASFVVGIVAEHLAHDLPGSRQAAPAPRAARQVTPSAPTRPMLSDDEFLGQVELAASRVGPAALRPLDALTPRPWDVR